MPEGSHERMAKIINLRRARKAKVRMDRAAEADANRLRHGVSREEREAAGSKRKKDSQDLDRHKIEE